MSRHLDLYARMEPLETDIKIGKHEHPWSHVKAGHDVRIWFPDWSIGFIGWSYDRPEVYDTSGREAGETESAECQTCGIELNVSELDC